MIAGANIEKLIQISEDDIGEVEQYFPECSFEDENARNALKCTVSRDIQAGPGSGKTTLLVAKLGILASKRNWRDQGVCVLSHTNVARREVENRLTHHPTAHSLLGYPHFIGTIQSFVDRFLALPYLRNRDTEVSVIDNDWFSRRANSLLRSYPTARGWFQRKFNDDNDRIRSAVGSLHYEDEDLRIGLAGSVQLPNENTTTHKELSELKAKISYDEGIFRFDDMYAFANVYISECPHVIEILRVRFPWVFIDEMQDTSLTQERLLERIFCEECVVQRFGDINQAIYSGEEEVDGQNSFPKRDAIDLLDSRRFGPEIAAFASNLTAKRKQTLTGRFEKSEGHTIFLFENETIHEILPAFVDLVLSVHSGQMPGVFAAKAVGFRRSGTNPDPKRVPFNIGDYWKEFQSDFAPRSGSPSTLVGYVRKARDLVLGTGETRDGYTTVLTGILRLLHIEGDTYSAGRKFSRSHLMDALESGGERERLQELVVDLCIRIGPLDEQCWSRVHEELVDIRKLWNTSALSDEGERFLAWEEGRSQSQVELPESSRERVNVFHHRGVDIEVGTIHGVKGETHRATLVLETFFRNNHDLKALLPYLTGKCDVATGTPTKTLVGEMQRVFVGMTRPRELVCLAMHREHLGKEDEEILKSIGWRIKYLRPSESR